MTDRRVILYGYRQSPFFRKTQMLLAHYGVPYDIVKTDMMPPRPMLSDDLSITYRRIPVLALDGELFIDTSAIARKLEEEFGTEETSLLLVQPEHQRRLALHWAEGILFGLAASMIPASAVSPAFIKDRQAFNNGRALIGSADPVQVRASLSASLHSLDIMLLMASKSTTAPSSSSATPPAAFLMATAGPQYLDFSFYFLLDWLQMGQRTAPDLLPLPLASSSPESADLQQQQQRQSPLFPHVLRWLDVMRSHVKQRTDALPKPRDLAPADAALHITSKGAQVAERAADHKSAVSADDPLVKAGSLAHGDVVLVTPTDGGRVPQQGILCALSPTGISLVVESGPKTGKKPILVHFPRNNFHVIRAADAKPAPSSKL